MLQPRQGVIIGWSLKGTFNDEVTDVLTSQMAVGELDDDDNHDEPMLGALQRHIY